MQHADAVQMLKTSSTDLYSRKVWADLGCGDGVFTLALASLLQPGHIIHAIDTDSSALRQIPNQYNQVVIKKWKMDFSLEPFPFGKADGLLMANSIHFNKDRKGLLEKLVKQLHQDAVIILVEYEIETASRWVPYPTPFAKAKDLLINSGFSSVKKISERPSVYRNNMIYSIIAFDYKVSAR